MTAAGRPDGDEPPEATLRGELLEEACAIVLRARLLGFVRSQCVDGWQEGLVLVRRALAWSPGEAGGLAARPPTNQGPATARRRPGLAL